MEQVVVRFVKVSRLQAPHLNEIIKKRSTVSAQLGHYYQAAIAIKISNLHICFCSFDVLSYT